MGKDIEELKPEEVLTLDIATKTGYYHVSDGGGVWDFAPAVKRNDRKTYKAFRDTLVQFIKANNIRQIVAEDVNVKGYFAAMRKLSEMRGIMREVCESLGINDPIFVGVGAIKYCLSGNVSAKKEAIIKSVTQKFDVTPIDDNHADAMAIYYYYIKNKKRLLK